MMGLAVSRRRLIGLLSVVLILAAGLPGWAAYTKLYKVTNTTGQDQAYLRAITNALEVITSHTAYPSVWSPPVVSSITYAGTYCTKLKFGELDPPVVAPGAHAKIGWRTADNHCRLRDLRWVTPYGKPFLVTGALQLQGVPGGGEVQYDAEASEFVWLLINDTGAPINLSDVSLEVLAETPTLEFVMDAAWPQEPTGPIQIGGSLPHPDLVAARVEAVIEEEIQPLIGAVSGAEDEGSLSEDDAQGLLGALDSTVSELRAGEAAYATDPQAAERHWADAMGSMEDLKALAIQLGDHTPQSPADYTWDTVEVPAETAGFEWGMRVNDSGQAAGSYQCTDTWMSYAYVWDPGHGLIRLPSPGDSQTYAGDINALGQVVGAFFDADRQARACVWEPDGTGGYTCREIDPEGNFTYWCGQAINDAGQVVGEGYVDAGEQPRGFLWDPQHGFVTIWPGGFRPQDINNRGQVVAVWDTDISHPYLVQPNGDLIDIHPGSPWTGLNPVAMTDSGQIAGYGWTSGTGSHACVWDESGQVLDLCTTHDEPWQWSRVCGVNDAGQVAGREAFSRTSNGRAILWDANTGTRMDLHQAGWQCSRANDVSETGIVVGHYMADDGQCHLFRGTPDGPPEGPAVAWPVATDATIAAIDGLPGDAKMPGTELEPPGQQPSPPPPPDDDPEYEYVDWGQMQQEPVPTMPPDSYAAFVVPDADGVPDETLLLTTVYEGILECVELYTAGPGGVPPPDTTPPTIDHASITPDPLTPADDAMVAMTLNVTVGDLDGDGRPQAADWYVASVSSSQGAGGEEPDWLLDEDEPHALQLRAECDADPAGRTYTVIVRAIDQSGNLSDPAAVQVQVPHVSADSTLAAHVGRGWYRFSVPVEADDPSPAAVLAGLGQARRHWLLFDRVGRRHYLYPNRRVRDFTLGRGYWLKAKREGTVEVTGQLADPGEPFDIELPRGWRIIGCPFNQDVPWDDDNVQVTRNGQTVPLREAVRRHWLWPTIYGWRNQPTPTTSGLVDTACLGFLRRNVPINPFWAPGSIEPWQGYLICARGPCTLSLVGTVSPESAEPAVIAARQPSADDWRIGLVATVDDFTDTCTAIGVQSDALVAAEPHPPLGPGVDLFVRTSGQLEEGSPGLAVDLRDGAAPEAAWDVVVATAQADVTVRISWPDLTELPDDLVAYFVDPAADRRVYMRTQSGYAFRTGDDGAEREFRVEVRSREAGAMITSLSALGAGGGAEVVFTLSADASVDATVLNIAGRTVRQLATDRALAAGMNSLHWDGRSATGTRVPSGRYLVTLTASSEDGRRASRIALLMIAR